MQTNKWPYKIVYAFCVCMYVYVSNIEAYNIKIKFYQTVHK